MLALILKHRVLELYIVHYTAKNDIFVAIRFDRARNKNLSAW